jgi:hypothetical protein
MQAFQAWSQAYAAAHPYAGWIYVFAWIAGIAFVWWVYLQKQAKELELRSWRVAMAATQVCCH